MRDKITEFIKERVALADKGGIIENIWRTPIVKFGDATRKEYDDFKTLIHREHATPRELLPEAKTIIAYFLPFREEIGDSNVDGKYASEQWAKAYEKTNAFFASFNKELIGWLSEQGYAAAVSPDATTYDETLLVSKWSQRHVAYYCGLGTFGINNMLITEAGCCGRVSTVVTDLDVEHDAPVTEEYCLFKKDNSCGVCVNQCPVGALSRYGFERRRCDAFCTETAALHVGYSDAPSYELPGGLVGSNCCGKCVTSNPCTYQKP
ncbi:MAG: epoxyqueuosine reductase [Firmicutes bacterium]|nr:epoxyqueuosine reductase [Bacillota bacterium]